MKSLIGRQYNYNDPAFEKYNAFVEWPGGIFVGRERKPEELYSLIVFKMKEMAETHLGSLVKDAVLTVPNDFNVSQRLATREAGLLAGLNVIGILEEPVAAAIAYGLDKKEAAETTKGNILIFDLGNGTLDVSVLSSENKILRVKFTTVEKFEEEEIEKHLIDKVTREIQLNFLSAVEAGNNFLKDSVEEYLSDEEYRILSSVKKALDGAKTDQSSITDIVFAGGLTKFPVIQKTLQDFFPGSQLHTSINPEEVVATGAAIVARRLTEAKTEVVSEGGGGAASIQDSGAQVLDTVGDQLSQQNQEDPSSSVKTDSSLALSPVKKKQKLTI